MSEETPRALDQYRLGRIYDDMGTEYRDYPDYSHAQFISILEGAIDVYQKVIEADTKKANWALNRLGFAELMRGNNIEAMNSFQKLLRSDIKNALAWEGIAEAYQHEGRFMVPLKAFTRNQEPVPESTTAVYHIARVHQRLAMNPEAIEHNGSDLELTERNLTQPYDFALVYALQLLQQDSTAFSAWDLVGDVFLANRDNFLERREHGRNIKPRVTNIKSGMNTIGPGKTSEGWPCKCEAPISSDSEMSLTVLYNMYSCTAAHFLKSVHFRFLRLGITMGPITALLGASNHRIRNRRF
ncbi:Tetratricopeptide repeat protein 37 [Modicella reniformis]|uniref:Tetratricopeptide repeat protein 37 n=1 Tax=Modicella reniformis TaxID=1440133 RepID=A0A9P6M0Z3_9FUNG|nr:Tetratricopeptide repeat protein 37 [Modicella reniformis]